MEKADFDSIYENYVHSRDRLVEVSFMDDTIEKGMLVGFFIKDIEEEDHYIYGWHFIKEEYIEYYILNAADFGIGKIIEAKDIKMVRFSPS